MEKEKEIEKKRRTNMRSKERGSRGKSEEKKTKTTICTAYRDRLRWRNRRKGNRPLAFYFVCDPGSGAR